MAVATPRTERLARELVADKHETKKQAMLAAGYSKSTAATAAHRVVRQPSVVERVQELKRAVRRASSDNASSIQGRALTKLGANVDRIEADGSAQTAVACERTIKAAATYKDSNPDEETQSLSDTQAMAMRLVVGGILLGARLGGHALETLQRYASKLADTRYPLDAHHIEQLTDAIAATGAVLASHPPDTTEKVNLPSQPEDVSG